MYSVEGFLLEKKVFRGKFTDLAPYEEIQENKEIREIAKIGNQASIAGASVTVLSGIIGLNPLGVFNLLNLIEVFIYSLLFDLQFDSQVLGFIEGLRDLTKFPSFVPGLFKLKGNLDRKYLQFGIQTSYFFVNFANCILVFVVLVAGLAVSKCFRKFGSDRWRRFGDIIQKKLVFGYFLRYLIQFSFDISLFCMISIKFSDFLVTLNILDFSVSCIVIVLFI